MTQRPRPSFRSTCVGLIGAFILGAIAVDLGHRFATRAAIDLGPTDSRYARGFREIERDGSIWFRWSVVPSSTVALPLRFCGPGTLRVRVRRHFVDPATLSVSINGTIVGQRAVQAGVDRPYEVIEFPVSKVPCDSYSSVLLETSVQNDRPLGVAVDWMEVRATDGFRSAAPVLLRGGLLVALVCAVLWISGAGPTSTLLAGIAVAGMLGAGFVTSPTASERMLRGGLSALFLTILFGALVGRLSGLLSLDRRARVALVGITLLTLLSRSAFLHPQAFYPDYRVHELVQQTLNRVGLARFLDGLFEIQYARSLGLQQIDGNWYPFPYPPGSYVVTSAVAGALRLDPLDASIVTSASLAAMIPVLTAALALSLGLGAPVSVISAGFVALSPLLVRRMALGYFPGIAGQFADAVGLLLLVAVLRSRPAESARRSTLLVVALLLAFLVYTQSIANFGLLVGGLFLVEAVRRTPAGLRPSMLVAGAAGLALAASIGVFYARYQPVFENIRAHRPQPESRVLDRLEQLRRNVPVEAQVAEADDLNDPFAGSTFDPSRGLMRLASRLWRFNGAFLLLAGFGVWLVWRQSERWVQNLTLAWAGVAVWVSVLAAGLPSPNGFQHLKDLEFVAPLIGLAMAAATARLWAWRPAAGAAVGASWAAYALWVLGIEWTARLLPMVDR